jgi:hypothetical protein
MYGEKTRTGLEIGMTADECAIVANGGVVADHANPYNTSGMVEVRRIDDSDDPLLTPGLKAMAGIATVLSNGDLVLYVRKYALEDPQINGFQFDRKSIISENPKQARNAIKYIPDGLINLRYDVDLE